MNSRRKRSPEEQARREKIRELLQSSGVSSMEDIRMEALSKQPDICSAHVVAVCPVKEAEK